MKTKIKTLMLLIIFALPSICGVTNITLDKPGCYSTYSGCKKTTQAIQRALTPVPTKGP